MRYVGISFLVIVRDRSGGGGVLVMVVGGMRFGGRSRCDLYYM